MTAQEIALQREIDRLRRLTDRMRVLATVDGFYQAYIKVLKDARSNVSAFDQVNEEYQELFGQLRYSNYNSFRQTMPNPDKKR